MRSMQEEGIDYNFIFMAQHRETIYEMLADFGLKSPDYVLCDEGVDIVSARHMVVWSLKVLWRGLWNKRRIFKNDKSGIVLIHGDAPPLFLGAVLAKLQGLKVGCVEAGLRSFKLMKPFPEEATRVFTGKVGLIDVFYCQDDSSMANAKKYRGRAVHTHGNTIIDAIRLASQLTKNYDKCGNVGQEPFAVVTLHRFETISNEEGLRKIASLMKRMSCVIRVKFILHPPTRAALKKSGLYKNLEENERIELVPRLRFMQFHELISAAEFMVTDGGSNQEEAAFLGIPCLIFRGETERQDGLGENAVLSRFDEKIIDDFLSHYSTYRHPVQKIESSPTDIIVKDVLQFA